jgi:hypothetical protein
MANKVIWQRQRFHYEPDDPWWESDLDVNYYAEPYRIMRSDDYPLGYAFEIRRWVDDKGKRPVSERPWSPMTFAEREHCFVEMREEYLRILEKNPSIMGDADA